MELIVRSGPDAGASATVEGRLTVGREAEFRLTDPTVSRMHAAVTPTQDGRAVIEDLGSAGGTTVNGARISGPVFLTGGERIQMGTNTLELVVAAAPIAGSPTIMIPSPAPTMMQPSAQPAGPPPVASPPVAPPPAMPPPAAPSPFDSPTFAQPPGVPVAPPPPYSPAMPFHPPPAEPTVAPGRSRKTIVIAALVGVAVIAAAIVLLTRGGGDAPAVVGGASGSAGGANTLANLVGKPANFTADPTTWSVTLTWDDAPGSFGLDHYEVSRDGRKIAANDPRPTFVDDGVVPGQVFKYSVIAVGKKGKTDPATIQVTTPKLDVADAHVDGSWVVSLTVSRSTIGDVGTTITQRWAFDPSCAFGSCDVVWTVSGKSVKGAIRASGADYKGTASAPFLIKSCNNQTIDETLALSFTVQKAQVTNREWAAATVKGTLIETATAGGCRTVTRTFDITALTA